jgi:hypothetical protein
MDPMFIGKPMTTKNKETTKVKNFMTSGRLCTEMKPKH